MSATASSVTRRITRLPEDAMDAAPTAAASLNSSDCVSTAPFASMNAA